MIGKVGSGKSSLLAAITAEMEKRFGEVIVSRCTKFDSLLFFDLSPWYVSVMYYSLLLNAGFCQET